MRQLNLPPLFWNVSHLKIFPLQLLGPAIGFLAGPSSCKGKILRWDTTTNSPTTNKCLILDVPLGTSGIGNWVALWDLGVSGHKIGLYKYEVDAYYTFKISENLKIVKIKLWNTLKIMMPLIILVGYLLRLSNQINNGILVMHGLRWVFYFFANKEVF